MRFFTLVLLLGLSSSSLFACSGGGGDNPPPRARIVAVSNADFNSCNSPLTQVIQVEVARTDILTVSVSGGSLFPVSLPFVGICGGVTTPAMTPSTTLTYNAANNDCAYAVSFQVTFNPTGNNRSVTLTATRPGASGSTRVLNFKPRPTINIPFSTVGNTNFPAFVCENNIFGGGSFSSTGPAGAAIQWTASTNSGGGPLSISSPNSSSTNISGFQASSNSSYTISVRYTCPGETPVSTSTTIVVLPSSDSRCGGFFIVGPGEEEQDRDGDIVINQPTNDGAKTTDNSFVKKVASESLVTSSQAGLTLYPNPLNAGDQLNIRFDERFKVDDEPVAVMVRDVTGKILSRQTLSPHSAGQVQTESLRPGMYFVSMQHSEEVIAKPFVVNGKTP